MIVDIINAVSPVSQNTCRMGITYQVWMQFVIAVRAFLACCPASFMSFVSHYLPYSYNLAATDVIESVHMRDKSFAYYIYPIKTSCKPSCPKFSQPLVQKWLFNNANWNQYVYLLIIGILIIINNSMFKHCTEFSRRNEMGLFSSNRRLCHFWIGFSL